MPQPSPKRIVVAINPSASFGAGKGVGPRVLAALRDAGHEVEPLQRPSFAELVEAGRAAVASAPDALVVVGGDGMVNLGANLCVGTDVPMGLVPSGTGNDMARGLGIPHDDTDAAIAALLAHLDEAPRTIDTGRMTWTDARTGERKHWHFACMLSAGFDAIVNERANRMHHPKGASRYVIAMLIELATLKPIRYRLTIDGDEVDTAASLVAVGNAVSLGGGMKLTPDAVLDDGLLDVAIVQPLGRIGFLRLFPKVFQGTHVADPRVEIRRARRIRIDADDVIAYGDGERVGALPVDVEVVPGSLRVLA